jgi:hypothetical protein
MGRRALGAQRRRERGQKPRQNLRVLLGAFDDTINGLAVLAGILAVYFAPTLVAFARDVPNKGSVIVINTLLGWTLVGWVVALAMAARSVPRPEPPAPTATGARVPELQAGDAARRTGLSSLRQRIKAVGVSRGSLVDEGRGRLRRVAVDRRERPDMALVQGWDAE